MGCGDPMVSGDPIGCGHFWGSRDPPGMRRAPMGCGDLMGSGDPLGCGDPAGGD